MQGYVTYLLEGKVRESLVSQLKRLGYRTVSLYATPGEFLNGGRFHQSLGFDEFLDSREQERVHGTYWQLSDRQIYETATRVIERHEREHPGQPLFVWLQTIRNHGPHGEWKGGECERLKGSRLREVVREGGFDPDLNCPLVDYLDRIEQSQKAYIDWKKSLANRFPRRSFSLVQFGDHHPILTERLRLNSGIPVLDEASKHTTFYSMDAVGKGYQSFAPRSQSTQSAVDLAYLGALWLQTLGLPLSPAQGSLLRAGEVCGWAYPQDASTPGGSAECLQALGRHHGFLQATGAIEF